MSKPLSHPPTDDPASSPEDDNAGSGAVPGRRESADHPDLRVEWVMLSRSGRRAIGRECARFATLPAVTLCDRRGRRHYGLGLPGPGRGNHLGIGAVGVLLVRDTQEVAQQAPDDQRRLRLRSGLIDRGARGIVGAFSAGEQLADHLGR